MKSGISNRQKSTWSSPLQKSISAPEIDTDSARRLTTKSIKLIHVAHAKAAQAI